MKAFVTAFVLWSMLPNLVIARVWTDRTGKHQVEAEFVELTNGKVTLKKANGKLITMALDTLSDADRSFAKEQAKTTPAAATDSTTSDVHVELVALAIAKREDESGDGSHFTMSPFPSGTSLRFRVTTPSNVLVGFDEHASKVVSFEDDRGTDLLKSKRGRNFGGSMFGPLRVELLKDGLGAHVDLQAEPTPAAGATKLVAKAQIVLLARAEKTAEQKDLTLTPGTEITTGPIAMSIGKENSDLFGQIGEGLAEGLGQAFGNAGEEPMTVKRSVVITSKLPMTAIKQIEFFTPDGEQIKHQVQMSMSGGLGKQTTYSRQYGLAEDLERVTLKVTYYGRLDPVKVPIDISSSVGF